MDGWVSTRSTEIKTLNLYIFLIELVIKYCTLYCLNISLPFSSFCVVFSSAGHEVPQGPGCSAGSVKLSLDSAFW